MEMRSRWQDIVGRLLQGAAARQAAVALLGALLGLLLAALVAGGYLPREAAERFELCWNSVTSPSLTLPPSFATPITGGSFFPVGPTGRASSSPG